jgi:hypothetical protein
MSEFREALDRKRAAEQPVPGAFDRLVRLRRRRHVRQRIGTAVLALVVAAGGVTAAAVALGQLGRARPAAPSIRPGNLGALRVAWTAHLGSKDGASGAAIGDGMVYVSSDKLYAFDAGCSSAGGECGPLWVAVPAPGHPFTQPVVDGNMVYASSGSLYAFPARCNTGGGTCQPAWVAKAPPGDAAGYSSPVVLGGVAYVNDAGGPYGFPLTCGAGRSDCAPVWHGEGSGGYFPPAVGEGLLFVNGQGTLNAYPTECGPRPLACQPTWTAPVGDPLTSPVVADGMVLVRHHALKAFRARCGSGGATCEPDWVWNAPFGAGISDLAIADGLVLVSADRLYALEVSCGRGGMTCTPVWAARIEGTTGFEAPLPAPFAADSLVFAAGDRLYAFRTACATRDCQPIWTSGPLVAGGNLSSPVASSNALYVLSPDGALRAFTVNGRVP